MIPKKSFTKGIRGSAIIVAISVLAILTLIIMGLAYSAGASRQNEIRTVSKDRATHLARLGFDFALATLSKAPALTGPQELKINLQADQATSTSCRISERPAAPTDGIYAGKFIKPRPGDIIINIEAIVYQGAASQKATQSYLLNVDPAHPRRLLYDEKVSAMEFSQKAQMPPAGSTAEKQSQTKGRK